MTIDTNNRNIFYPKKTPKNKTKKKTARNCKKCALNGFPGIPIRWQKYDGKWVLYEIRGSQIIPHEHQIHDEDDILQAEFEIIRGR